MNLKENIREDLYNAIVAHYEKEDYTESLRDALFLIKDILQEKSGNYDKDNTGIVDFCLLGKAPAIKLNKGETRTEIDFQQGIGFAVKGLYMHIRNPISHEKTIYTKEDADSILLYINYLLSQIDKSNGTNLIEDWMDFIMQPNFTSTKEYAEELIKELPVKKCYDLLVNIYREKTSIKANSINNFIAQIVLKLNSIERKAFIELLNNDLKACKPNYELSMFFHFFAEFFYDDLKKLVKLHIEDMILNGFDNAEYDMKTKETNNAVTCFLTWVAKFMNKFSNKKDIYKVIYENMVCGIDKKIAFINNYCSECVNLRDDAVRSILKKFIEEDLKLGYPLAYDFVMNYVGKNKDSKVYLDFKEAIEKYEKDEKSLPF